MKIKDISPENRPRGRLQALGPEYLSSAELLAIILQVGSKQENVIDMSNRLISKYSLEKLSRLSLTELQEIKGIGPAKAMQIKALFELNKRVKINNGGVFIKSAKDVFDYLNPKLSNLDKEHFIVLHLNTKNKIIKEETISIGILDTTILHPREVFKSAIKESASSIILVHNHPSGDPEPSENDKEIIQKIMDAGELLNIKVLDHVIIGKDGFYSWEESR